MDVFDLDRALVSDYEWFARSFTQIKAEDIKTLCLLPPALDKLRLAVC